MADFDTPTYVIDYRNSLNRATLESAKPGKEITVLVRQEEDPKIEPIRAKGTLSSDSTCFTVVVTTEAGQQSFEMPYDLLQATLSGYRR